MCVAQVWRVVWNRMIFTKYYDIDYRMKKYRRSFAQMATSSKDFPIDSGAAAPPAGGGYACGWAHAQGRRSSMEDEVILGTPLPTQADGAGDGGLQLWAVMDGHAGRRAVELLVTLLPEAFARATRQALTTSSSSSDTAPLLSPDDNVTAPHGPPA